MKLVLSELQIPTACAVARMAMDLHNAQMARGSNDVLSAEKNVDLAWKYFQLAVEKVAKGSG